MELEHSSLENSEGSRGKAGTWTLPGWVRDRDGKGEENNPPQLMETWGCSFPAGRRWVWLSMGRLKPQKSLCVPSCPHSSALTHLRDLSRVLSPSLQGPEPGWVPRDGKWGYLPPPKAPSPTSTAASHSISHCPEENPALGHSSGTGFYKLEKNWKKNWKKTEKKNLKKKKNWKNLKKTKLTAFWVTKCGAEEHKNQHKNPKIYGCVAFPRSCFPSKTLDLCRDALQAPSLVPLTILAADEEEEKMSGGWSSSWSWERATGSCVSFGTWLLWEWLANLPLSICFQIFAKP